MSETVAFTVYGDTHEECVDAAIARLPEFAGAGDYKVQRQDDLVAMGHVTWALTSASSRRNFKPSSPELVCDVTFERYG